ncbi:chromate efflux transporter [Corallococcus exercitus]|uniref:chromate efflux transporter n=1 Tax=Corallococcus exercitus TaxID=2316736 RepID=UPI0035D447C4
MDSTPSSNVPPGSLGEVARVFLRLGLTSFGGPAAHIAMMEDELVRRRRWLPREEFLDLLGATHLIPGPNSTELAIHLGHRRAGWPGLVVAGVCFIVPAMLLTLAAAWAYVRFGTLPQAGALLYGVKPVILAVVLQALWGLGKTALTTRPRIAVAIGATVASAFGINELLILAVSGAALAAWLRMRSASAPGSTLALAPFALQGAAAVTATASVPFSLGGLFLFFLKVGSVLFGSGYVLLAFLRADLVEHWGWLTEAQLLDAVAVGQFTPGPVFTTATFIGYLVGGAPGAGLATLGIFLPAFVFVALSGPLVPRLRRSRTAGAVLDGVNAASLALMAVVTWQLGRAALVDAWTVALAALGALLLLRWRINSAWLVLGGAAAGLLRPW